MVVAVRSKRKPAAPRQRRKRSSVTPAAAIPSSVRDLQCFDTTFAGTFSNVVNYQTCFTPIQGSASNNRYGDRTTIASIRYTFVFYPGATQAAPNQIVRCIILWDSQPNGANPSSPLPLTSASVSAFTNPDYRFRFKILRDFLMAINPPTLNVTGSLPGHNASIIQKGYIKNCELVSVFIGNAGSAADMASGSLVCLTLGDTLAAGTTTPTVSGTIRCLYRS